MPSPDQLTRFEKATLNFLARTLLNWATSNGRDFPWRSERAGKYEKVVVEVLLQRTTATAVGSFYEEFFRRFPNWSTLEGAEAGDLEEFLRPLGLWRRRAAALRGLAGYARASGGEFPTDASERARIPAVGQYVSNAIAMFHHGHAEPLLDTNMARVIERVLRPRRLADIRYDPWLQVAAKWLVRRGDPAQVNWAVLDFAAVVCKPRRPLCEACPVVRRCRFGRATVAARVVA